MAFAPRSVALWLVGLFLIALHGFGEGLRTSELGNEVAYRRTQTIDAIKKMATISEANARAAQEGVRSVADQLNAPENAALRKALMEAKPANAAARKSSRRVADGEDTCTRFKADVLSAYADDSNESAECGIPRFTELNGMMVFDLLLRESFPAFKQVPPRKPNDKTWNDLLQPFCTYTDGTGVAGACGTSGFYARTRNIAVEYAGQIDGDCTWDPGTSIEERPLDVLNQIIEVFDMCLIDSGSGSGDFCYPAYWETLGSFFKVDSAEDPSAFLQAFVPQFCSPCAKTIFDAKAARAPNYDQEAAALQSGLLCSQVLGNYCFLEIEKLENAASVKEEADIWCDEVCMPIIASKWGKIDALQGYNRTLHKKALRRTYCADASSSERCYERMGIDGATQLAAALENLENTCVKAPKCGVDTGFVTGDSPCASDISDVDEDDDCEEDSISGGDKCEQSFTDFTNTWGCCAMTFLNNAVDVRKEAAGDESAADGNPTDLYLLWFMQVKEKTWIDEYKWRCSKDNDNDKLFTVYDFARYKGTGFNDLQGFNNLRPLTQYASDVLCNVNGAWDIQVTMEIDNLSWESYSSKTEFWNAKIAAEIIDNMPDTAVITPTISSSLTQDGVGVQVEISVPVTSWTERQAVLESLGSFNLDTTDPPARRSGTVDREIFLLSVSKEPAFNRANAYELVYGTFSNVRVVTQPFVPDWGASVFDIADVASQCNETRSWKEMIALKKNTMAVSGGLGKKTLPGQYEAWICLKEHPCLDAMMAAFPVSREAPFSGGVLQPSDSNDLMCFTFDEERRVFEPWGFNSQLKLVGAKKLNQMRNVSVEL